MTVDVEALKRAIDGNDLAQVAAMMTRDPQLHSAPLGYGGNGPLTWVAECRVPWAPPASARLEIATWMIDHGSDVHQGGDGPLMRAALRDDRVPMMELLVSRGADVNARWNGSFPIIFSPCESLAPGSLRWLLEHGADPNCGGRGRGRWQTALDYAIGTYARSPKLAECIDMLLAAGTATRYDLPAVLHVLRGDLSRLAGELDGDPSLVDRTFPELDVGATAQRGLTLAGATLLHVAAEYGAADAARLLLERGANVNARAAIDASGRGGQTPIFHAVAQWNDYGLAVAKLFIHSGADLSIRATLPGHYERPGEVIEATPLEYATMFPGDEVETRTLTLLRG